MTIFNTMIRYGLPILIAVATSRAAELPTPVLLQFLQEKQILGPSDGQFNDAFGTSLSLDGNTLVVGAARDGDSSPSGLAAYVFVREGANWIEQAILRGGGQFGFSVGISGDTIVVGSPNSGNDVGQARVFVRSGTNWSSQALLAASDAQADDLFGHAVAISGNTIVVGAYGEDEQESEAGAAYVFVRNGTTWTQQQKLMSSDGDYGHWFGYSVDIDGDMIVVGNEGSIRNGAYVFVRSGTTWTQQQKLNPSPVNTAARYGAAVGISGDTVVVGAPTEGSAFIWVRNGATWTQQQKLRGDDTGSGDRFGSAVAIDGDAAVIGAHEDNGDRGSAYVFIRNDNLWTQQPRLHASNERTRTFFGISVAIQGTTMVAGSLNGDSPNGAGTGSAYSYGPLLHDAAKLAGATRQMLYYPDATTGFYDKNSAALRYKHLLYGVESNKLRARFEVMSSLYGPAERDRAAQAEALVVSGLAHEPTNPLLGNLLLDIHYDRTVAETILVREISERAEKARFGPPISPPADEGTFYIDNEIPGYESVLEASRAALQGYFDLLKSELGVQERDGPPVGRWATGLLGFSSENNPADSGFNAVQVLGEPNTYPDYGLIYSGWASANADGQREFLELGYDNPAPVNSVSIYETFNPGAVDRVAVRNPDTGLWQEVWSGTAAPAGNTSRVFTVTFPLTTFPVSAILIEFNSPAVPGYNQIDAVSISTPTTLLATNLGYHLFQALVPDRALMAATYTNSSGMTVPVTTNAMLFSGYKDLVLLFDLLRDHGRTAHTLATLLVARDGPGDVDQATVLISETERFLFLQGSVLKNIFPSLPPAGDPSGLAEAIQGWAAALQSLANLQHVIAGEVNVLGFAPDFLMLVENFQDPLNPIFDSFDSFRQRLTLSSLDSPLRRASDRLEDARNNYDQYRGYEDQIREQFDQSTISYEFRLFEIVGARPGEPDYSDVPTNNPGSELDQQYRSIELARLKILRNQTEINNLAEEAQIEINRAMAVSNAVIRYGNMQADVTRQIGHIKAAQAAASALADAFSPEKLLTRGVVVGVLNAAAQAGAEEGIAHLEVQKEQLAAEEQAVIEGIDSAARVKTLLLGMRTLAVDSMEAALLLQQEVARMAALYREKSELEARIAERNADLASRYFADPIHRLGAEASLIRANQGFAEAQRWLFFMVRALEYKWNTPFENFVHPPGGRTWSARTLYKLRNADELVDFYDAMNAFDALINRGKTFRFDWFSVREDFMGLKLLNDLGQPAEYADPETGLTLDAISMFRTNLLRRVQAIQDGRQVELEFNTVRQIPGGFFFVGPTFNLDGSMASPGRFLDKIDYLQINLPGDHTLGRSQLAGNLAYGGTSFIRNLNVGHFDPNRPDRLIDELTAYNTRYWFYDPSPNQMRWRFNEGLTINGVEMQLTDDPRIPPTVTRIEEFKERSVAATGWKLTIPLIQQNVQVLKIDELNDVEIFFHHYSAQRQ